MTIGLKGLEEELCLRVERNYQTGNRDQPKPQLDGVREDGPKESEYRRAPIPVK